MVDSISELKSALEMYQAQYASTDKLWGYFSTVTLALVAYTISSDKVTRIFPEAIAAIGAYIAFCFGNFAALSASQQQLGTLAEIVRSRGGSLGADLSSFRPFATGQIAIFYWAVVGVIVLATFLLVRYRSHHH